MSNFMGSFGSSGISNPIISYTGTIDADIQFSSEDDMSNFDLKIPFGFQDYSSINLSIYNYKNLYCNFN